LFASEHTRLINKFIGLCKNTIKWPKLLHELGYEVQLIEQTINLESAEKVTPDVVSVSNKHHHTIVTDCKGGNNIDSDQDRRYSILKSDNMKYYVTTHDSNQLTHTVSYVDHQTNHANLKSHTKFPFITFGESNVQGDGDFGFKELNEKLCKSTSLDGMREPTGYYPFSPDDEDYVIAPHILRGLISFLTTKGRRSRAQILVPSTFLEILKIIHPYDLVSTRHKDRLIKKIEEIINLCMKSSKDFNEQIFKIEKGEYNTSTLRSLVKICEKLLADYETQKKITDQF